MYKLQEQGAYRIRDKYRISPHDTKQIFFQIINHSIMFPLSILVRSLRSSTIAMRITCVCTGVAACSAIN